MARAKRIQSVGYHYIMNQSVELRHIFIVSKDYLKFMSLCQELSRTHDFNIHAYSLVPNAYYLLLETKKENLSAIMKILNSRYSLYFNQEYERSGHLWKGRYKSTFIQNVNYTYYFIRYMEHVPNMMGITLDLKSYSYSSYRQLVGLDACMEALKSSILFKRFNSLEEIKLFLSEGITKDEIENIIKILSRKDFTIENTKKKEDDLSIYFGEEQSKQEELKSIVKAYENGFSQKKIADYLGLSQQAIYLRLKRYKQRTAS